jgi:hypothetical protein
MAAEQLLRSTAVSAGASRPDWRAENGGSRALDDGAPGRPGASGFTSMCAILATSPSASPIRGSSSHPFTLGHRGAATDATLSYLDEAPRRDGSRFLTTVLMTDIGFHAHHRAAGRSTLARPLADHHADCPARSTAAQAGL